MKFYLVIILAYLFLSTFAFTTVAYFKTDKEMEEIIEYWPIFKKVASFGICQEEKEEENILIRISSREDSTLSKYTITNKRNVVLGENYFYKGVIATEEQKDTLDAHIEQGKFNIH
tara:strand:+ start:57 stop:404 length:348 start_codon:yes stop_codon:yes gene_type:complete